MSFCTYYSRTTKGVGRWLTVGGGGWREFDSTACPVWMPFNTSLSYGTTQNMITYIVGINSTRTALVQAGIPVTYISATLFPFPNYFNVLSACHHFLPRTAAAVLLLGPQD